MKGGRTRCVGVSLDVMGTLVHIRGHSVGAEYQRVVRDVYFNAVDPKPGCLAERLFELEPQNVQRYFKAAFKSVSNEWPALATADRVLQESMGRRAPVVGGADPTESYAFWRHVVHRTYRDALQARAAATSSNRKGGGKVVPTEPEPLLSPSSVTTDREFLDLFDTIFNHFQTPDPFTLFEDSEYTLQMLKRTKRRALTETGDSSATVAAGPGSATGLDNYTDSAVNPYAWHGHASTRAERAAKDAARASYADGVPRLMRISAITNFDGRIERVLQGLALGWFFDDIFTTHQVPRKPSPTGILRAWGNMDPAVRRRVAAGGTPATTDAPPESDWLHIGDSEADVEAAAAAGARVLLVDPKVGLTRAALQEELNKLGVKADGGLAGTSASFRDFEAAAMSDSGVKTHLSEAMAAVRDKEAIAQSKKSSFKPPPAPSNLR